MIVWLIVLAGLFLWMPVVIYRSGNERLHAAAPAVLLTAGIIMLVSGRAGAGPILKYSLYCTALYGFSFAVVLASRPCRRFLPPESLIAAGSLGMFGGLLLETGSKGWGLALVLQTSIPLNTANIFGINALHGLFYNQSALSGYLLWFPPWWQAVLIPVIAAGLLVISGSVMRLRSGECYDH